RLRAEHIVRITAWVEGGTLARPVAAYFFIDTDGEAPSVGRALADRDEVDWLVVGGDGSTVVCSAAVHDHDGLLAFANDHVRCFDSVRTVLTGVRLKVWPTQFRFGVPGIEPVGTRHDEPTTESLADDIDQRLLRALID